MTFDLEADNLLDKVTKIHCLSFIQNGKVKTLTKPTEIKSWVEEQPVLIGHNIVRYDIPTLEKVLQCNVKAKLYDTLPMSWVMFPQRNEHGLDSFGKDYGIPKPKVTDWSDQPIEVYINRCEEDVKINEALWSDLIKRFKLLYRNDKITLDKFLQYLTFKMKAAAAAEKIKWKLDKDLAQQSFDTLEQQQQEKVEELKQYMPMVPKIKKRNKPANPYKKDGTPSVHGRAWFDLLQEKGLPKTHGEPVEVLDKIEAPNPNSPEQVKAWLFSLGWEPCTYKYDKDGDGNEKKIPQIRYSEPGHPRKGELTDSVILLADEHEGVKVLDGLSVIQHRKTIFKSFLESVDEDGYVKAEIAGLTNTLRFQHRAPLVNLPGVDKPWGKEIRGCLIAPEGYELCGSDMTSLESTTKRHFIYPYDPEYVAEMSQEGFDEHLDLAVKAAYISKDDYEFYIRSDEDSVNDVDRYKSIKTVRKKFKPVNYSSVYGVGKLKMSRSTGMKVDEAGNLIEAYWQRNWAVKAFAEDQEVRTIQGQMWILNPVNGFWYSLRYDKDRFSTLNQGTGAYCFDTWLAFCMAKGVVPCGQFHDEFITPIKKGTRQWCEEVLQFAIKKTNEKLKLNVDLGIDIQFGSRYSEIH